MLEMRTVTKWFVVDTLRLVSTFGMVMMLAVAVLVIQNLRPAYEFLDVLVIVASGMVLGALYLEARKRISSYLKNQNC